MQDPAQRFLQLPDPVKTGTICIYGIWHGRPFDNVHVPTRAEWDGSRLLLEFDQILTVELWNPVEFEIEGRTLHVPTADRVVMRNAARSRLDPGLPSEVSIDIELIDGELRVNTGLHVRPSEASLKHPAFDLV